MILNLTAATGIEVPEDLDEVSQNGHQRLVIVDVNPLLELGWS
jgi:hypothetical protein